MNKAKPEATEREQPANRNRHQLQISIQDADLGQQRICAIWLEPDATLQSANQPRHISLKYHMIHFYRFINFLPAPMSSLHILCAIFSIYMISTYQPVIHGNRLFYYVTTLLSQLLLLWTVSQPQSYTRLGFILYTVITIFSLQLWKLSHPILMGSEWAITTSFSNKSDWSGSWNAVAKGSVEIIQETHTVVLITNNISATSLHVSNLPTLPTETYWSSLMRPIIEPERIHERRTVAITCLMSRVSPYLIFFSSNRLTIQLVDNGILITSPSSYKDVSADFIPVAQDVLERFHTWHIFSDGSMLYVSLDDTPIWSHIQVDPFDKYIIGDQSLDPNHGGQIHVKETNMKRNIFLT